MIERTTFDLRLADHATTTARINDGEWRPQGAPQRRALRSVLAAALVALAARLAPASVKRSIAAA